MYIYCMYIFLVIQGKRLHFAYGYGFTHCLSAKLMKDMEPYFRFDNKIGSITLVFKFIYMYLIYLFCFTWEMYFADESK